MAEKDPPYFNLEPHEVVRQVMHAPPPSLKHLSKWGAHFSEFVRFCLQKEPTKRCDASTLLKHPFITESHPQCLLELVSVYILTLNKAEYNYMSPHTSSSLSTSGEDKQFTLGEERKRSNSYSKSLQNSGETRRKVSVGATPEMTSLANRRSQKRINSGVREENRVKVHLGTSETTAKRIMADPTLDVAGLAQKCHMNFKISDEEAASYSLFFVSDGYEDKLSNYQKVLLIAREKKRWIFYLQEMLTRTRGAM